MSPRRLAAGSGGGSSSSSSSSSSGAGAAGEVDEKAAAAAALRAAQDAELYQFKGNNPPSMAQRELIFDSKQKIVNTVPSRSAQSLKEPKGPRDNENFRGTWVFTWGAGYNGQLGKNFAKKNNGAAGGGGGQKKYSADPVAIDMEDVIAHSNSLAGLSVRQIAAGGLHSAIVTESGQVYTWGTVQLPGNSTGLGVGVFSYTCRFARHPIFYPL